MPPAKSSASLINVGNGTDVLEALAEAAAGQDAWLQAVGQMEDVELRVAGEGADPRKRLRGRYVVASLAGPAGGPFGVVLSRDVAGATEVVAGQLMSGRSAGLTLAVLPMNGTNAERVVETEPAAEAPLRAPAAAPVQPQSTWARSAAATAALTRVRQPEPEVAMYPDPGDLIHHFAFGLCAVLIAEGDSLKIRDLEGPGRVREIRLDKLRVLPPVDRDGKRLFKLERKL